VLDSYSRDLHVGNIVSTILNFLISRSYLINYFSKKIVENSYICRFSSDFHDLYVYVIIALRRMFL